MTYNPNVPNAAQSPGIFPAQAQANFTRLQTIITTDHVFNVAAASTDGIHKQVTTLNRVVPTALAADTDGVMYSKAFDGANELYWYNGLTDRKISGPSIFAAVNFNGTGLDDTDQAINSSYTVDRVYKDGTGYYTVFFKQDLPNTDYIVLITGMRIADDELKPVYGFVESAPAYGDSVKVGQVAIAFHGDSDFRDVVMGNVVIYQIT